NSTAVAGGMQIAVGSANGYPAVWRRTPAGAWTLVSSLGLVAADPHLRALTSVTHGPAGWLAAGAPGPVVLTSADGEVWGAAGPGRRSSCPRLGWGQGRWVGPRPGRSSRSRSTATVWSPWARPRSGRGPRSARLPAPSQAPCRSLSYRPTAGPPGSWSRSAR